MKKEGILLTLIIIFVLWAQESDYVPGEMLIQFQNDLRGSIVIKEQDGFALIGIPSIDELNRRWQVSKIKKVIVDPNPDEIAQRLGLDMLYHFTFPKTTDIDLIIADYEASPKVKYAGPNAIYRVCRTPNDSLYPEQWHLPKIGCPDAWDITTGDTLVVNAVIDDGINYEHWDIRDNVWVNSGEDINHNGQWDTSDMNGIDDDNNGFVDDLIGWDFIDWDPDPRPIPITEHGTLCFGVASAVTDNRINVASVGWDTKGMALRCGDEGGIYLYSAIQGIYYAADNGAWVINMCYGRFTSSELESLALVYAWQRGLVECAATGYTSVPFYPAAYSWVIGVAASDHNDQRANFSGYGEWIDLCAPGVDILTTSFEGYAFFSGTSAACPCVTGAVALLKSAYPNMTNAECTTLIFQSCDTMPDSLYRRGLLGHGRLNVGKAILQPIRCNLLLSGFRINDQVGNNNGIPEPGETVALIITLANDSGWQDANDVSAILTNDDPEIEIIKNTATFPMILAGNSGNCSADSFVFRVSDSSPPYQARFGISKNANPPTHDTLDDLFLIIGSPRILLTDDDDGDTIETWYQAACDSLGVLYNTWTVTGSGSPPLETLSHYPVVIWFTGRDSIQTLTPNDMIALSAYLDNGGNLFLCGQNIGQEIGTVSFYANYLHARYCFNHNTQIMSRVIGIDDDPIGYSDADTLVLIGTGGENNAKSLDGIQPLSGATASHHYRGIADTIYAGIHFAGNYKAVYFGFPFEAIDASPHYTQKWEILRRILLFFNEPLPGIEQEKVEVKSKIFLTIKPNPFYLKTTIHFYAPTTASHSVFDIYDVTGKMVNHWRLNAGQTDILWDGTNNLGRKLPNGIYLCVMHPFPDCGPVVTKVILLK